MNNNYVDVKIENEIGWVTLNRPPVNALNLELLLALKESFESIENDEQVKVVVLTGTGKAFVAGADIGEMADKTAKEGKHFGELGSKVFRQIETLRQPVIAAVNGFALGGGCELAMSCDLRIASIKSKFGQPEVSLGIVPGFDGTQRLSRLIGRAKAKEMIFTGDMIDAEEAERIGLVNKVVSEENLLTEAKSMAERILKNGQIAVRYAKAVINEGIDVNYETASQIESLYFGMCFATEDQKEGMDAFMNKRKPEFNNK